MNIRTIIAEQYNIIPLGRQGEHQVREIVFDYSDLEDRHPNGYVEILFVKPGTDTPVTLPLTIDQAARKAHWLLQQSDLINHGEGKLQMTWHYDSDKNEKTRVWQTKTEEII